MKRLSKTAGLATLSFFLVELLAYADNCGSLADCFFTIRAATAAAIGIAITMIVGSLLDFLGLDNQADTSMPQSWTANDPTADIIVHDSHIRAEIESAFLESHDNILPDTDVREQGGWIVRTPTGKLDVVRWPEGESGSMVPPERPNNAVAHFHTHPYGNDVVFKHAPSPEDTHFTKHHGVPGFIIDRVGIMRIDPIHKSVFREVMMR